MARPVAAGPSEPQRNAAIYVIGYLMYAVVAIRLLTHRPDEGNLPLSAALLGAILLLTSSDPFLFRRLPWYRYLYFPLLTGLIQALGLLHPDQDVWGVLYVLVSVQARYYLSLPVALVWGGCSAAALVLTLMAAFGWAHGMGFALTYLAACILAVSWDLFSSQAEAARRESQALLAALQQAHQQLQAYAARIEEHAALRERDRLAHELHDSVSQTIFGIALTAESTRLLIEKDPARVPAELERLQELTSSALGQMRSLIGQWRAK